MADWIVYGYKTELEKSGIQVIPVERLPHNVSGFRIKITDSYAGFDNRSAYTRIGYNVTCIINGNKTAVIEVLGEGLYDTNRRSIVYDPNLMPPALSESMTIALQNAIDGSLPKIQSVLDRGSSY